MILLADKVLDGREDQHQLGGLDVIVRRNAFGRQVDSFEEDLDFAGLDDGPVHAVFIRAPWVESVSPEVEVLATVPDTPNVGAAAGRIVAIRQGPVLATAFHPELTGDGRVHRMFVEIVRGAKTGGVSPELTEEDERPLQVGHHQAQEGRPRRQAWQAVRETDQEHRGCRADRRGRP